MGRAALQGSPAMDTGRALWEAPHMQHGVELSGDTAARSRAGPLLLLLACGVGALRLVHLGRWSLWYDEALTWADAHHAAQEGALYNPFGYRAIRGMVELLGGTPDELALRLLPALAGWLVVPSAYWAFQPFVGGARAGLVSLLLAASPWQLYWSQNARFYTLAELVSLIGSALMLRAFLRGGVARGLLGAALVGGAALLHLQAALLLAALTVAPALLALSGRSLPVPGREPRRVLLALAGLALPLAFFWIGGVWTTYVASKAIAGEPGAKLGSIAHFVLATASYVTPLWGAAFLIGAVLTWRRRSALDGLALVTCVLALAGALIASLFARVTAQYVFVLSPWIVLVATAPLSVLSAAGARLAFGLLLFLPTLAEAGLYTTRRAGERERWREAWLHVLEQRRVGDLVAGMAAPVGELYLAPSSTDLRSPRQVVWIDSYRAGLAETWSPFARRVWFVIRPDSLVTWDPRDRVAFQALLREECRLSARFPVSITGRELAVEVYLRE